MAIADISYRDLCNKLLKQEQRIFELEKRVEEMEKMYEVAMWVNKDGILHVNPSIKDLPGFKASTEYLQDTYPTTIGATNE